MTNSRDQKTRPTDVRSLSAQMADRACSDADRSFRILRLLIGEAEKGLDDVVAGRSRSAQPFLRAVRQRRAARSR